MKSRYFLASIATVAAITFALTTSAVASPAKTWIQDGVYVSKAVPGTASIRLTVLDSGTFLVLGHESSFATSPILGGVACLPAPALVSSYPSVFSSTRLLTTLLDNEYLTSNGEFSLTQQQFEGTNQGNYYPITLTGHFIRGRLVPGKTIAVVVTLSAPQICDPSTPMTFQLVWK
jgi:hypothetical protein